MEPLKKTPLHLRFGTKVFLFNILIIIGILLPALFIWKSDYQYLMSRIDSQRILFYDTENRLEKQPITTWKESLNAIPEMFVQQRFFIFNPSGKLIFATIPSGLSESYHLPLIFPHPYIEYPTDSPISSEGFTEILRRLPGAEDRDYKRFQQISWTIDTGGGLDRIVVMAKTIKLPQEDSYYLFVMSSSILDILLQKRAMKERYLLVVIGVIILAALLSRLLNQSVVRPFRRLHRYAYLILTAHPKDSDLDALSTKGEIGEICRALGYLIREQHRQSENLRDFSSDVVHELKTPLAAIRSGWDIYAESHDSEEKAALANRVQKRMARMESLMDEIARLGKLEADSNPETCETPALMLKEIQTEYQAAGVGVHIENDLENAVLPLSCGKFHQVVTNLVDNAISFSPELESVQITAFLKNDHLKILIRDNGPGIPENMLPNLTDRFFSYRPEGRKDHSGLGLAIVKVILDSCRGEFTYRNLPDKGAEFSIEIPLEIKTEGTSIRFP